MGGTRENGEGREEGAFKWGRGCFGGQKKTGGSDRIGLGDKKASFYIVVPASERDI